MQQFSSLLSWRLFTYSSTCFGRFPAHHQELNDRSGSLWFYLRIVVIVLLCSWSFSSHHTHALPISEMILHRNRRGVFNEVYVVARITLCKFQYSPPDRNYNTRQPFLCFFFPTKIKQCLRKLLPFMQTHRRTNKECHSITEVPRFSWVKWEGG
jgi:hypothetical protein